MAEKQLTLNQQLALMPASIPDSVLDFLEDFQHPAPLQSQSARDAFDQEYLKAEEASLQEKLQTVRKNGPIISVAVEQSGRETPGGFLVKLGFAQSTLGIGILTRLKERTILRLLFPEGEYNDATLKDYLKNPR